MAHATHGNTAVPEPEALMVKSYRAQIALPRQGVHALLTGTANGTPSLGAICQATWFGVMLFGVNGGLA